MNPFSVLLLSLSSFLLLSTPTAQSKSQPNCSPSYCTPNGPQIRFPFSLSDPTRCGYPGFNLSCNENKQIILTLPNSGHFLVTRIDYATQSLYLNDPNQCLPNRILNKLNLSGSPFRSVYSKKYTFYNCTLDPINYMSYRAVPIQCLSKNNNNNNNNNSSFSDYMVVVTTDYNQVPATCKIISSVMVPVELMVYRYDAWVDLTEDILLTWHEPGCGACETAGGRCGFKNGSNNEIECFDIPSNGLSKNAKYAISVGLGVPGLACIIGFLCYSHSRLWARDPNNHTTQAHSGPSIAPQPAHLIMGLDGPTIDSYPKTVLGESGRLPKPNDGTCSICLAEYLPKEILRSIPECNHYFHANCVDEWLKMNATCPLCRNTPSGSLTETPSSSLSLSLSSSSSASTP